MRRLLLVVSMVVLAGCNRDMFKAGAGVAAVAGAAKLSPERLADFVLEAKGAQLNNETADFITVLVLAMVICFFATLYPSRQAAKLDPAEALRFG